MSGRYTGSNIEAERAQIDDRISQLECELHDLRRRRNALALVSCLPPEILLEVFHLRRERAISDGKANQWIAEVTHICQHWRNIALTACALWVAPDFLRPDQATEMLRRSGGTLLDITFKGCKNLPISDSWQNGVERVASTLASEIGRVRSVDFKIAVECPVDLLAYATCPAPVLERLNIVDSEPLCHDRYHLPADLFSGVMPNLRTLGLKYCMEFDLSHASCANLECLSLNRVDRMRTTNDLHTVILSMKRLRELVLVGSIPDRGVAHNTFPISLANLRTLSATDSPSTLAAFLTPLQCTLSATGTTPALRICCARIYNGDPIRYVHFVTQISLWVSRSLAVPLHSLSIDGNTFRVRGVPASLVFSLSNSSWPLLEAFILAFPLPAIETISASGPKTTTLGAVLARAQGLKTLDLDGECAEDAIRELGRRVSGDVPHLQHIVLRNLCTLPNVGVLWRMLETRLPADDEKAVATLTFHGCGKEPHADLVELVAPETRLRVWWDDRLVKPKTKTAKSVE